MRHVILALLLCSTTLAFPQSSAIAMVSIHDAPPSDSDAVRQLEDEWLKAERTTDITAIERIMADDYAGIGSNGTIPSKAQLLSDLRSHAGQAPPYTVDKSDMRIFLVGNTLVATYTKTYTAKENGNVNHEDMTDIFVKEHGVWKLRFARSTLNQ